MAARKIPTFTPDEWAQVEAGKRAVLEGYSGDDSAPSSTPAPPPSGAAAVRPIGALPSGFKSDQFTFAQGGPVINNSFWKKRRR